MLPPANDTEGAPLFYTSVVVGALSVFVGSGYCAIEPVLAPSAAPAVADYPGHEGKQNTWSKGDIYKPNFLYVIDRHNILYMYVLHTCSFKQYMATKAGNELEITMHYTP